MGIFRNAYCPGCDLQDQAPAADKRFHVLVEGAKPQFHKHRIKVSTPDPHCETCQGPLKFDPDYFIDYTTRGRRVTEKAGPNKKYAEDLLAKRKVAIRENKHFEIRREHRIRFKDFAGEFYELHSKVNKLSWERDLYLIENLKKFLGNRYLSDITPQLVEQYKSQRLQEKIGEKKTIAPATVNREVACLKCILNKAVEWGKVEKNAIAQVKKLKENNARTRFLEREEIDKLLEACDNLARKVKKQGGHYNPHLKAIIIVALNTGMRRAEILNLKWRDYDFRRGTIHLLKTKNGEKREVPVNELVKTALMGVRKHPESPFIFCGQDGQPFYNVRRAFLTALEESGITDFTFHSLRHTAASQLVMAGVDMNTVQKILGHKDPRLTLRYAHLSPGHVKDAVDILARRLSTPEKKAGISEFETRKKIESLDFSSETPKSSIDISNGIERDTSIAPVAHLDRAQVS